MHVFGSLFSTHCTIAIAVFASTIPTLANELPDLVMENLPASVPVASFESVSETVASAGIRVDLSTLQPQLVGSIRYTETSADNQVIGAMGDLAVPLSGKTFLRPSVRALGIYGDTDVQGTAGVGYDLGHNKTLVSIGALLDYLEGGINILGDGSLKPYLGATLYEGPAERRTVTRTVSTGTSGTALDTERSR